MTQMDRHLVISSDCHAGPPLPEYREYVEPRYRQAFDDRLPGNLLLPSGLGGAALLVGADIVARSSIIERELNVGVVTALIGAPFFLWLVIRSRREMF